MTPRELENHVGGVLDDAFDTLEDGVALALSGGLDSSALLDLLDRWCARREIDLLAIHVDHRLRASSKRDASFCRQAAARRSIPFRRASLDVRHDGSLQARARQQRYAGLARLALEHGVGAIVTAHHANDVLEGALLRLRRGGSSAGLGSLLGGGPPTPISSWPDLPLVRPLVDVPRTALKAYANHHDIDWVEDPTNVELDYDRNRLRHEVIAELTDGGELLSSCLDSLRHLAQDADALDEWATSAVRRARLDNLDAETAVLIRDEVASIPRAVTVRLLQRISRSIGCRLSTTHLDQLTDLFASPAETTRISVGSGRVTVTDHLVFLEYARGRGGRHLAEREARPVALALKAGESSRWFDTVVHVERPNETNRAPDVELTHAPSLSGTTGWPSDRPRPPRPLRWRWPCVRSSDDTLVPLPSARRTDLVVRDVSGESWQLRWEVARRSAWTHLSSEGRTT